jgi:hypothetical protein
MKIDASEFRRLVALLAVAACDRSGPPVNVTVPPENAPPAVATEAPLPPAPAEAEVPPPSPVADDPELPVDPSCSNAKGSLASCSRVGPACEGLASECKHLVAAEFRPRVAEAVAQCFAKARPPKCRDKALGACMRKAVESACVEPDSVATCRSIMKACRAAHREPAYTLAQCAAVISAVTPRQDPSSWDRVDEERLGPSGPTGEGCTLRYVLPYQPWGPSWD